MRVYTKMVKALGDEGRRGEENRDEGEKDEENGDKGQKCAGNTVMFTFCLSFRGKAYIHQT